MKKKVIIAINILIIMFTVLFGFGIISRGNWIEVDGVTWYYKEQSGEAVDVYIIDGTISSTFSIPEYLNGLPVTKIGNRYSSVIDGARNKREIDIEEINIPSTVKTISSSAFENCKINGSLVIPDSVEIISNEAFLGFEAHEIILPENTQTIFSGAFKGAIVDIINIPNSVQSIGDSAFEDCSIKSINIPENVTEIGAYAFKNCNKDIQLNIPSSVKTIREDSFLGIKDVYVDNLKEAVTTVLDEDDNDKNIISHIHYKDCTHKILKDIPEGVKLIDVNTNQEITENELLCGLDITLSVNIEEGYEFTNLVVSIQSEGDYKNSDYITEQINVGETYTFHSINRNKIVHIQDRSEGLDLSLRQYIDTINNKKLIQTREPNVKIVNGQIQYQHSKKTVYINQGDTIVYNIRVYNEGTIDGTANKITQYLPEGVEFNAESVINLKYEWEISEDGRVATTEYLAAQNIQAYAGGSNVNYKELSIECIVNVEDENQNKRLVNIAEITEASDLDIDSVPGNITEGVDSEYLLEESEVSNSTSYIVGEEDDNDFESINIAKNVPVEYAIRINKIDDLTNELLNGAKFELLNENKEVIQTGVTANGGILDFGMKETTGEGEDIYYIKEISTPPGYKNTIKYTLKIVVKKEFVSESELQTTIETDIEDIDIDTSKYKIIPIYTKEQLKKIGNNEEVYIEEVDETYKFDNTKKYKLMQDIDLQLENWTPIDVGESVILDGNGHKILNLKIESNNVDKKKYGLFSRYSGIIENVTIENVDIDITKVEVEGAENAQGTEITQEDIDAVGSIVGYLETGILKNCKVTGEINTSVDNVGGLVGHTKERSLAVFRDCINEANISVDGSNAGGIVGCSLGAINVVNSQNKGEVSATTYNAGGLIGCAEPKSYTPEFVQAGYDSTSKVISIVVKNEIISGKYNLRLEKVDETKEANLLNGAKFNIYDSSKNLIEEYENVPFKDGVLELPKTINSLVPDVYYLKEVEEPNGYRKITNEYIRIEIPKGWNYDTEEYTVNSAKATSLSEEEFNEDIVNKKDEVGSGEIYNGTSTGVTWVVDNVNILENSKNEGRINSENLNAAGFLGRGKATITIKDSTNEGEVNTKIGNAAGMVGQAENEDGKISKLYVENSNNNGIINQTGEGEGSELYTTAGIVARVESNVEINNTNNYGAITAKANAVSGMIGLSYSNSVMLDTCVNSGNVLTEGVNDSLNANAGGMIAKNFMVMQKNSNEPRKNNEKTVLKNCSNIAEVTGNTHSGGMIGTSNVTKVEVSNCTTENSHINVKNGDIGGIIGTAFVEEVNITDCTINNNVISNMGNEEEITNGKAGGIIGSHQAGNENITAASTLYLTINNCEIIDTEINSKQDTGGIVGSIIVGNHEKAGVSINECSVINLTSKTQAKDVYANSAGIIGTIFHVKDATITNSYVESSNITLTTNANRANGNIAGICALNHVCIEDIDSKLIIKDCNVNSSNINADYITGGSNASAIAAIANAENILIENTDVTDVKLKSKGSNTAGIIATENRLAQETGMLVVNNCNIDNLNVENECAGNEFYTVTSGLVGVSGAGGNGISKIQNCSVINSTISGMGHNTAGAIGVIDGSANIDNIELKNTNISSTATYEEFNDKSITAGILATMLNREDTVLMSNCTVNECEIKGKGIIIGGIVGWNYKNIELENCKLLSSSITDELNIDNSDIEASRGGIIGVLSNGSLNMVDCSVSNTEISGVASNIGGFAGYAKKIENIDRCKFENSTIIMDLPTNISIGSVGGFIGSSDNFSEKTIQNSSIIDVNIQTNEGEENDKVEIGGIFGYVKGDLTLSDNTIDNINITNSTSGDTGGVLGMGEKGNVQISNLDVAKIEIVSQSEERTANIGGIIGISDNPRISDTRIEDINIQANKVNTISGVIGIVTNTNKLSDSEETLPSNAIITDVTISKSEEGLNSITATNATYGGILLGFGSVKTDNININDVNINVSENAVGVGTIGTVGTEGENEIKNITLENSEIIGYTFAGGIIGLNIENSPITNCTINNSTIMGKNAPVGGIVGGAYCISSPITGCRITNSTIKGENMPVGGIVGLTGSNISECTLNDLIIRGKILQIIGEIRGTGSGEITNCTVENVTKEEYVDITE